MKNTSWYLLLSLAHSKELELVAFEARLLGQFHEVTGWVRARAQDEDNG